MFTSKSICSFYKMATGSERRLFCISHVRFAQQARAWAPRLFLTCSPRGDVYKQCCCVSGNKADSRVKLNKVQLASAASHPFCLSAGDKTGSCAQARPKDAPASQRVVCFQMILRKSYVGFFLCRLDNGGAIYGLPRFSCPGQASSGRELNCL